MMTFEEAKKIFLNRGYIEVSGGTYYDADKWREAITVISKWLEQEPCDDAVSRQTVIDMMNYGILEDNIKDLLPVIPKEKTGKWIGDKCSNCGNERAWYGNNPLFCPDCGAKMIELQESEE